MNQTKSQIEQSIKNLWLAYLRGEININTYLRCLFVLKKHLSAKV